jgi:hypothetical protein
MTRPLAGAPTDELARCRLDLTMFDNPPLLGSLSELVLEYRIVRLYSHHAGLGFRNEVPILFDCRLAY